jgi:hypothetical protein
MFRAAVLSIVLTLTIGPNTTLLCSVWCHPMEARASACQHQDTTVPPRVTGGDSCCAVPASTTAFVREEAKREPLTVGDHQAVPTTKTQLLPPPIGRGLTYDGSAARVLRTPPLLIALRI